TFKVISFTLDHPCSSLTVAATPASATPAGAPVSIGAAAAGCVSPLYRFWVQLPGDLSWTMLQDYSPSSTLLWSTAGLAPGVYHLSVWARETGSANTYDAYNTADHALA